MLYKLGRVLQIVGLILLPLSAIGVIVFGVGYFLQQAGRPK
jgi:hypothetical protein